MYIPKYHRNENVEEVKNFVRKNSFGTLVSQVEGKPWASHTPLELEQNQKGENVLLGHISRGNPQWKNFSEGLDVLAIFQGPHSYISSSWYDHENVPSWNYIAVHIYGKIKIIEEEELLDSLKKLVNKHEANSKNPISVESMSETFLKNELKGIVGFEISIEEIHSAYKLSQNRDKKNYNKIIEELTLKNDSFSLAIADEMKKTNKLENL